MVIVNPWITLLSFVYFIVAGFGAFVFSRYIVERYLDSFKSKFFKSLEPVVGVFSFSSFFWWRIDITVLLTDYVSIVVSYNLSINNFLNTAVIRFFIVKIFSLSFIISKRSYCILVRYKKRIF